MELGSRQTFQETVLELTTAERIEKAESVVYELTNRVQEIIRIHVSNEIIFYSNELSDQIPRSYAGHAFNLFQEVQFRFEVIRLLALWDRADHNTISIPTVTTLIQDPKVMDELALRVHRSHVSRGNGDYGNFADDAERKIVQASIDKHHREFAKKQSEKAKDSLNSCIALVNDRIINDQTNSLRNLRDHLAHSLLETKREMKEIVKPVLLGDEKSLLNDTVQLIEDLYCWVNGISFDLQGSFTDYSRKCSRELWSNCTFDIPSR